jgi:hypothetical protein
MELNAYLKSRDGKVDRFGAECRRLAKRSRTTPYYLYMLALGHKSPSMGLAQRIAAATKGHVGMTDWPLREAA